jgi:hypothetical protein
MAIRAKCPKYHAISPSEDVWTLSPKATAVAAVSGFVLGCVLGWLVAGMISFLLAGFLLGLAAASLVAAVGVGYQGCCNSWLLMITSTVVGLVFGLYELVVAANSGTGGMLAGSVAGLVAGLLLGGVLILALQSQGFDVGRADFFLAAAFLATTGSGVKSSFLFFPPSADPAQAKQDQVPEQREKNQIASLSKGKSEPRAVNTDVPKAKTPPKADKEFDGRQQLGIPSVQEAGKKTNEGEAKAREAEAKAREREVRAHEREAKAREAEVKAHEAEAKAREAEVKAREREAKAREARRKLTEKNSQGRRLSAKDQSVKEQMNFSNPPPVIRRVVRQGVFRYDVAFSQANYLESKGIPYTIVYRGSIGIVTWVEFIRR